MTKRIKRDQEELAAAKFVEHLERSSTLVQTWPDWKRNILRPVSAGHPVVMRNDNSQSGGSVSHRLG